MSDSESLPSDIEEEALKAICGLLPEKSKSKYEMAYAKYEIWCTEKEIRNLANEKVLLSYFSSLSKVSKPSSLWACYSMIRTMISVKHNADIKNQITVEPAIPEEASNEENEEDDEEEEGILYNESNFRFEDFAKRLPHPKIVRACGLALRNFDTNTVNTNHCIIKLLHRIAFDCKMYVMVFQLSIFRTFQKIFQMKESPEHKELVKFATYIVRQFIKVSETNKKVFMEALFWKSSRECYEIEHGYMEHQSSAADRAWTEEQEDEVRRLFMEHQQSNNQEDVVDWITDNLIDQTKSRRQVLKKLKELMLLVNYKKKSASGKSTASGSTSRAPPSWNSDEESNLQELFRRYKDCDDPLGNIMDKLDVPRPRTKIVEKLLVMGLIQDKKELRKKRAKRQKSQFVTDSDNESIDNNDSDNDSVASDATDSFGEDDLISDITSSSNVVVPDKKRTKKKGVATKQHPKKNVAAQTKKGTKKNVSSKSKESTGKRKPAKQVPMSKAHIARMLIKVVDQEMHEALEWLKESLSDAIEDYEVGSNEGIPLVPVMDYAETAIENPEFQQMLKALGVCPPFDEQEVYWRIPGYLTIDILQSYCDMIRQALDKTLQNEEEPQITSASTLSENVNSSDDDDLFNKLKKITKSNSPERGLGVSIDQDENSNDSNDQENENNAPTGQDNEASVEQVRREMIDDGGSKDGISLSSEDGHGDPEENEETALVQNIEENINMDDDNVPQSTRVKKKKSRIIQESDDESDNEVSGDVMSQQESHVDKEILDQTSFSSKTKNPLESDSEEEKESKAESDPKRTRSVSDSDSEKPAAKKGRIIDSDDDD